MTKHSILFALVSVLAVPALAQTTRISIGTGGVQGNADSNSPALSDNCRFVAFFSEASNLVPNDNNGSDDIFVRDRRARTTTRVSVDSFGVEGNGDSYSPSISGDGRYVAFYSEASNLVPADNNGVYDAFVHDRATGVTTRISEGNGGVEGDGGSWYPVFAADGRFVVFFSFATNLVPGDTNGQSDVFVHDLLLGATTCVSVDSNGAPGNDFSEYGAISGDGGRVVFISRATNLSTVGTNGQPHTFVRDLVAGTTVCVSVNSSGAFGNAGCSYPAISRDGTMAAFETWSSNLDPSDTNNLTDVYVHELATGTTSRISVSSLGVQGDGMSTRPSLSADGRFVGFKSVAHNLVPGDTNSTQDIFRHDRVLGTTVRFNVSSSGAQGLGSSSQPVISADGRHMAYYSFSNNLIPGDTNSVADVFFR